MTTNAAFFARFAIFAVLLLGQSAFAETPVSKPVHIVLPLSAELLELGVHGTVTVQAMASLDNKVENQVVLASSGSQKLDDYAQAKLADAPISPSLIKGDDRALVLEVDLYSFNIGMDFGSSYACEQAVRDHDWYVANNPGQAFEHGKYYHMFGGLVLLSDRKEIAFAKNFKLLDQAWITAIERCRQGDRRPFLGVVIASGNGA